METIRNDKNGNGGAFVYYEGDRKQGEMVYIMASPQKMIIDHTDVAPELAGKGVGKKLLEALVNYVRQENIKVIPLCPFAHATFKRVKEWQDVLE